MPDLENIRVMCHYLDEVFLGRLRRTRMANNPGQGMGRRRQGAKYYVYTAKTWRSLGQTRGNVVGAGFSAYDIVMPPF